MITTNTKVKKNIKQYLKTIFVLITSGERKKSDF